MTQKSSEILEAVNSAIEECTKNGAPLAKALLEMCSKFPDLETQIQNVEQDILQLKKDNDQTKRDISEHAIEMRTQISLVNGKITNLQDYIGSKISDNSKEISKFSGQLDNIKTSITKPIIVTNIIMILFIVLAGVGALFTINLIGGIAPEKLAEIILRSKI